MSRLAEYLFAVGLTLWLGALWTVGLIVAPTLFQTLADRSLAGLIAGKLFHIVGWIGLAAGLYGLIFLAFREGGRIVRSPAFWLILTMLVLTCAAHFGIAPLMAKLRAQSLPRELIEDVMRNRFAVWHGISSVLYIIQCALGVALVTQIVKR